MSTKTLLALALPCHLIVAVNSATLLSGRGFETTQRSRDGSALPPKKESSVSFGGVELNDIEDIDEYKDDEYDEKLLKDLEEKQLQERFKKDVERGFVYNETADSEDDRSIGQNNNIFLKWKSKFLDCLENVRTQINSTIEHLLSFKKVASERSELDLNHFLHLWENQQVLLQNQQILLSNQQVILQKITTIEQTLKKPSKY